jgi:alpha-tubulin suppressor-like RCC1 family protein
MGQLGNGTWEQDHERKGPVRVGAGYRFSTIATGLSDSCALDAAGALYCWGISNTAGAKKRCFSIDEYLSCDPLPRRIAPGPFRSVSLGLSNGCAVAVDGTLYCFGSNEYGQSGPGDPDPSTSLRSVRATSPPAAGDP